MTRVNEAETSPPHFSLTDPFFFTTFFPMRTLDEKGIDQLRKRRAHPPHGLCHMTNRDTLTAPTS